MEPCMGDMSDLPSHCNNTRFILSTIRFPILILALTLMGNLAIVQRNPNMPTNLSIWEKKNIMEWSICRMSLRNVLKCTTNPMQNDVTGCISICTITWNDGCNLIHNRCIVSLLILLIGWCISHPFSPSSILLISSELAFESFSNGSFKAHLYTCTHRLCSTIIS